MHPGRKAYSLAVPGTGLLLAAPGAGLLLTAPGMLLGYCVSVSSLVSNSTMTIQEVCFEQCRVCTPCPESMACRAMSAL